MIYFHSFRNPGLIIDIVQDIRNLNEFSRTAKKAGMIILGGGVCKHQIANAMLIVRLGAICREISSHHALQRNGADFSVFIVSLAIKLLYLIVPDDLPEHRTRVRRLRFRRSSRRGGLLGENTCRSGDGEGEPLASLSASSLNIRSKVYADATLIFPLLVAATFAKDKG